MYPQFQNSQEFALYGGVIFDTLANRNKSRADGVFISALKCWKRVKLLKGKRFAYERGFFQKKKFHKLCQNVNFENGGTTYPISILHVHVLLNILSISLLAIKYDTSGYFQMQKSSHFEEN